MKKHVGIDVAKNSFDLHILEDKKDMHFEYQPQQVKQCVKHLLKLEVGLIVLEATGGYEISLVSELQTAGLPVAVVNPRRIRDFAKASGTLAKTDKLDATVMARFGATLQPPISRKIDAKTRRMRALVARRNQLVKMHTAENNRMEHAFDKAVVQSVQTILKTVNREIEKVERQINDFISQQPELKQKAEILKSAKGIGDTTASMLVSELPELGQVSKKAIASLVGVAPMNRDSGQFRGKRMTGGGRRLVRSRLYMPTLVAIRYNPAIKKYYQHLLSQGKPKKVAIIAAMRKLLIILNTMTKNNQPWTEKIA